MTKPSSIRFRFTASLLINVGRAGLAFVAGLIVARGLGPHDFGTYTFLIGSFTAIATLVDMGSSTAFFTFLSQRPRDRRFFTTFVVWQLTQYIVVALVIGLVLPRTWIDSLWVGHPMPLILAALGAYCLQQQVWQSFTQLGFAVRSTYAQLIGLAAVAVHLALIGVFWWQGRLTISLVLSLLIVEYLGASALVWVRLRGRLAAEGPRTSGRDLLRLYWEFCSPLVLYSWFSFLFLFVDNWLLQRYGGGYQQGYYAVAMQFTAISMFATASMLQVFWKEIAEAHANNDSALVERLYTRVARLLYAVAAAVGGFLIPWSAELINFTLGPGYLGGVTILQLALLHPLYQTVGQVNSTMFYATSRTTAQVRIGIASSLLSLPFSYFMVAAPTAPMPGLGLGGLGSIIKLLVTTAVTVNATSWWFCRTHGWKFDWSYQVKVPAAVAVAAAVSYGIARSSAGYFGLDVAFGIALAVPLYGAILVAFAWRFPHLIGLGREDLHHLLAQGDGSVGADGCNA